MISGEKATFKCPRCDETYVGNSAEIAVWAWGHYQVVHKNER